MNINLKRFKEETYLLLYSLYLRNQRPKRDRDIIQFFLANMFICKNVIVRIVRYIVRLLPNIQQSITDYNERKDNRLIKIFHEFTGYCNNISIVINLRNTGTLQKRAPDVSKSTHSESYISWKNELRQLVRN